jgi:predicted metal-dependent phosphoesterase TrpH
MIDLHVHSTASDGTLTPTQLVERAVKNGVRAFALTDHDTVAGLPEVMNAAQSTSVEVIPGIEVSVECPKGTFHILGLFINYQQRDFLTEILDLQKARAERNPKIIAKLNELGVSLTMEDVLAQSGGGQVGRVHVARALVAKGWCATVPDAFGRYLAKGKAAYFKKAILTAHEAIALIRRAGGVAVVAHPFSLEMDESELRTLLTELAVVGLAGVEVYYPMHTAEQREVYGRLADQCGLIKTGGTDYHGDNKPGVDIGKGLAEIGLQDAVLTELKSKIAL